MDYTQNSTNAQYIKDYSTVAPNLFKLTREPDIFTLDDDILRPRALMSCSHAVLPNTLTQYIFNQLDKGKTQICCPYVSPSNPNVICGKEWKYPELRKMGLFSAAEQNYIELKMSLNVIKTNEKFIECPTCANVIERRGLTTSYVSCRYCERTGGKTEFCANCYKAWSGRKDSPLCENTDCKKDHRIDILLNATQIQVKGCFVPSIRSCPQCGILIEKQETPSYCKTVICPCGCLFCFVCLGFCDKDSNMSPCYENSNTIDKRFDSQIECTARPVQKLAQ